VLQKNKAGMFKKNILAIPVNYQKKTRRVPSKTSFFFKIGQGLGKMELKRM